MEVIKKIVYSMKFHCLLAAFVFITLCSKSSFFYPLNDWGDVNCYFVIGHGMLKGLVPYRDLYDQKGIVVFALYAIATLISTKSFIGVYILQIISAFFFIYISLKIAGLFCEIEKYSLPISFIVAGSVYSSASVCPGGSAEEILLPLFSFGLYLCIKQIIRKNIPSSKEMLILGVCAGLIFYSKYTLCIFYLALITMMIISSIINKQFSLLMKRTLIFIAGCIIVSIIVITYFAYNHALNDFYMAYFYNNIFNYIPKEKITFSKWITNAIFYSARFFRKRNILDLILIALSFIYLIKERKHLLLACHAFAFIVVFYMQFFIGVSHQYYGIPLYSFEAVGLCMIVELFEKKNLYHKIVYNAIIVIIMIITAFAFMNTRDSLFQAKDDTVQYKFATKMEQYGYDEYQMISYNNLDNGFYFATGKFPDFRAFIQTNLITDELKTEQYNLVNDGQVEFIVTNKILCDSKDYAKILEKYGEDNKEIIVTFDNFKYDLVDESNRIDEYGFFVDKLYKRKY